MPKRKAETESDIKAKCSRVEEVLSRGNNALMQLNEIRINGLQWSFEQMSNVFPQRFKAICLFTETFSDLHGSIPTGTKFYSEGLNKSTCRYEIASQIIIRLSGRYQKTNLTEMSIIMPPAVLNTKPAIHNNVSNDVPKMDDAVRLLNEKVTDLQYNFTHTEHGFCCSVSFRGFMIKGIGSSKKLSKRNVAVQILKKYFKYLFPDEDIAQSTNVDSTTTADIDKLPLNRRKNFSDNIQEMIKNSYNKLVSNLEVQYSKRKVLSGIVISRKLKVVFPHYHREQDQSLTPDFIDCTQFAAQTGWRINPDDCGEILKVVTISSGTKCLSGNEINLLGNVVNDCHAEVISKRALQYFLHRTIERLMDNVHLESTDDLFGTDILEIYSTEDKWTYRLKEDVKFHLYVSSAPCGDARIYLPQPANNDESDEEKNEEDSHPNRKNRGLLRTKIECGEGTIPIKLKHVQTWDGILGGERLLTMSCSDKVCVWNVLGLQGALLSNVLSQPLYLDSIIIGSLCQLDHSQRALYERAKGVTAESDWMSHWPNGRESKQLLENAVDLDEAQLQISADNVDVFRVNSPHILTVTEQDEKCLGKASNFSANWILGENNNNLEIIATNKGLKIDNEMSRLSKRSLLKSFLGLIQWSRLIAPGNVVIGYNEMKSLLFYPDNAVGAVNYQRKKIALFKFFDQQTFGRWICKPFEQDLFGLQVARK